MSLEIRTELEIRNDMKNSTILLSNLESIWLTPVFFAFFADFSKVVACHVNYLTASIDGKENTKTF